MNAIQLEGTVQLLECAGTISSYTRMTLLSQHYVFHYYLTYAVVSQDGMEVSVNNVRKQVQVAVSFNFHM